MESCPGPGAAPDCPRCRAGCPLPRLHREPRGHGEGRLAAAVAGTPGGPRQGGPPCDRRGKDGRKRPCPCGRSCRNESAPFYSAPGSAQPQAVDVLVQKDGGSSRLSAARVHTYNSHGTGCTLASAVAAGLARGLPLRPAVSAAKQYVFQCLQNSSGLLIGTGGPRRDGIGGDRVSKSRL